MLRTIPVFLVSYVQIRNCIAMHACLEPTEASTLASVGTVVQIEKFNVLEAGAGIN
jgi:hypothetical protein